MSMGIDFDFTEKFICLQSTISAGFTFPNVDIEPIYLDIDVDNEILGQKKSKKHFQKAWIFLMEMNAT